MTLHRLPHHNVNRSHIFLLSVLDMPLGSTFRPLNEVVERRQWNHADQLINKV